MKHCYCAHCNKDTWHKKEFGWGTFFAVVATGFWWLLALPFYPNRCVVCHHPAGSKANVSNNRNNPEEIRCYAFREIEEDSDVEQTSGK